jgi:hypothetical protein
MDSGRRLPRTSLLGNIADMRWKLVTSILAGLSLTATAAHADYATTADSAEQSTPIRAVIELFTSQGCSSCPPADALLQTYATDPGVIALSLPVDYWDYLGWKDTFASARNTDRQRAYAKARGDGAIYTPQAVVNGSFHVNGAQKAEIDNAIDITSKNSALPHVGIRFWQEANTLNIITSAADAGQEVKEATVWLGVVQTAGTVDIQRGENAGQKLVYTNIVRDLTPIGLWKGQQLMIQIPRAAVMQPATQKSVVLIQEGKAGAIIGAAWAGLW